MKELTLGVFLRINTRNSIFENACLDLFSQGVNPLYLHRSQETPHYPETFASSNGTHFNSGDLVVIDTTLMSSQQNPSKNRTLRVFSNAAKDIPIILNGFNRINESTDSNKNYQLNKPSFSSVINERFIPGIKESNVESFILLVESKNPQIVLYTPDDSKPFHWFAVHNDYTFFLITTQSDPVIMQEYISDTIPGSYIFAMGSIQNNYIAFHSLFLCQKYRRLERSLGIDKRSIGGLRALAGVEEYLARLSSVSNGNMNEEE